MDGVISENIKAVLLFAENNHGKINDSIQLKYDGLVNAFYESNGYKNIWSKRGYWLPVSDSMFHFLFHASDVGLFKEDYHLKNLELIRLKLNTDSIAKSDANLWTKVDLMLTDAFMKAVKELREGRLVEDSISIVHQQKYIDSFFIVKLNNAVHLQEVNTTLFSLEPTHPEYIQLRSAVKSFVANMDSNEYETIQYPYKDSLTFVKKIYQRLAPLDSISRKNLQPSLQDFSRELKRYQKENQLIVDGKVGAEVVNALNLNDRKKFLRIAITLDRYKLLPAIPQSFIWVNIPGFYLRVWDNDTVALWSKVVVGKPTTKTPALTSLISDLVTYPKWTIPQSIIKKDILPQLKIDPGYLQRKGFSLVDEKGETVNPYSVNWSKYSKGIPWNVVQGSGDDNALGVIKFNFNNPYSVYLHDTNQRYLFQNANRALSHGCVRVEKWEGLSYFISRYDKMGMTSNQQIAYNEDSIKIWIAQKSRKRILIKNKLRLFIGYYTCVGKNDEVVFYKDIYEDDKRLAAIYFGKQL
jgi:murein L,D-transpeptidase YcbB/YkuD